VTTPLLVVGEGPYGLLLMWEPYSALHHLQRPVELMLLNTREHILTNPALRMASQGGSVDWFRFWLQDYEDPDPGKQAQYVRWRELRKMQDDNHAKGRTTGTRHGSHTTGDIRRGRARQSSKDKLGTTKLRLNNGDTSSQIVIIW